MKKTRVTAVRLFSILVMLVLCFSVMACVSVDDKNLVIDAPTEKIEAELGSYPIPTYNVVNGAGVIMAGYTVTVKSVTDPDGKDVPVAYGSITAEKTGIYTFVYTVGSEKVADVTVRVDFADRTAPTIELESEIPAFFMTGNTYDIPTFKINGGPDTSKCYTKVFYADADGNNETEVTVDQGKFFAEKQSGNYTILIHVEDAAGNVNDYKYTRKVDGPEKVKEDVILYFDDAFGARQVSSREPGYYTGEFVSKDVEGTPVYGNENGSYKITLNDVETLNSEAYFIIENPAITDVSKYDHLEMWVYNDNDFEIFGGTTWWNDTKLESKKWTRLTWSIASWGNNCDKSETKVHYSNIIGTQLRLMGFGAEKNPRGTVYFSNMVGVYSKLDEIVDLDNAGGADRVTLHGTGYTGEHSTEMAHVDEKGSYKLTMTEKPSVNGEMYVRVTNPLMSNVKEYDYISLYIYNDNDYAAVASTPWAFDQPLLPNSWNRVKYSLAEMDAKYGGEKPVHDIADGTKKMYSWDINNFTIRITGFGENTTGVFYLSSFAAERATIKTTTLVDVNEDAGPDRITLYQDDKYSTEYTTDKPHGSEAGSLKVTKTDDTELTHNTMYLRLTDPAISNLNGYNYIEMYIYNDTDAEARTGTVWAAEQKLASKEWTKVTFAVSLFGKITDIANDNPGQQLPVSNIKGFSIRLFAATGTFSEGATFYVSSIKAIANERANERTMYAFDKAAPEKGSVGFITNSDPDNIHVTYDTTKLYGNETGSTKLVYDCKTEPFLYGKMHLGAPLISATEFDYLGFYVYNDSEYDLYIGFEWGGDTTCAKGEWTFVSWKIDGGKTGDVAFEGMSFLVGAIGYWTNGTILSEGATLYMSSWFGYNISK